MVSPPDSPRPTPVRYGTRYGSPSLGSPPAGCPVCAAPLPSRRARYCSAACKQRAYRLQHAAAPTEAPAARRAELQRLGRRVADTLYECPSGGARFLGEQRCPDCHRICRALGLGGACPHCDELLLSTELLA
jgi:hypothetical protein